MKVYISYKREDVAVADRIADVVRAGGHDVWRDMDSIAPGVDFRQAIQDTIRNADVVVVLWSERSRESAFLMAEASYALEQNKYLGFAIGTVELPFGFQIIQHLFLERDGSEPRPGLILEALAGFEERLSEPRSVNRSVRQATKRERKASAPAEQADLDIPPFLRRAPEAPPPPAFQSAQTSAVDTIVPSPPAAPSPAPVAAAAEASERGYDVFISYSRKDTGACELAFKMLVERDLVPWYDKDMGTGAFKTKIDQRISKSSVFVLLLSKNSVASPNVSKELSMAVSSDRLIIPISIDGIAAKDLHGTFRYELIELNIFSANPAVPESWAEVVKTIADGVSEVRAEAGATAGATPLPLPAVAAFAQPKRRPTLLFAGFSFLSALLQQAAVGYVVWDAGADIPLAVAAGVASGVVVYPLAYGAALLARLAFKPNPP